MTSDSATYCTRLRRNTGQPLTSVDGGVQSGRRWTILAPTDTPNHCRSDMLIHKVLKFVTIFRIVFENLFSQNEFVVGGNPKAIYFAVVLNNNFTFSAEEIT